MQQDWIYATAGGVLIGIAATIHLLVTGRITGVSGIFAGILKPVRGAVHWQLLFVVGLMVGGWLSAIFLTNPFVNTSGRTIPVVILAGLLVGFGTRLGSGCTSGHGVCGLSRLSPRSLAATISFIVAGILAVSMFSKISGGM